MTAIQTGSAVANQVLADIIFNHETEFGTSPAAGVAGAKKMRRVSASLALGKDGFSSAEARSDQQVVDFRHGTKRPGGGVEGELANAAYDDFLEALLRGTWTAGTTVLPATYTTIAAAVTTGTALAKGSVGTFTWTAGDAAAAGLRVGDVIQTLGIGASNDGVNFRIIGISGATNRTITVTPAPAVTAAIAGTNMKVVGKKLTNGVARRSFTIEQNFPDIDLTELYRGMRLGSGALRVPPNGMATCSFSFMGVDMSVLDGDNAPYFTAPTEQGTGATYAGPSGSIRVAGGEQTVVTALDVNIDNALSADPVIGSDVVPEVYYGTMTVTGSVSFFLKDKSLISAFVDETEVDIVLVLTAPDNSFIAINMQRVKLNGASKTVGAAGGVVVTAPFQALLKTAAAGHDGVTITIQRSNA